VADLKFADVYYGQELLLEEDNTDTLIDPSCIEFFLFYMQLILRVYKYT
jgi:hypothetical protein